MAPQEPMGQVSYLSIGTLGAFFFWWETLSLHGLSLPYDIDAWL